MKTEWFNQFNKDQQKHILYGLKKNLDVSYLDELAKVTASMFFPGVKKNE